MFICWNNLCCQKNMAPCQMEKYACEYLYRYVCTYACLHICIQVCKLAVILICVRVHVPKHVCVCVCVCVREMMEARWLCLEAAATPLWGVNTRPDTCFSQNELWNEAKRALFPTQLTTEAKAKDLRRDRMRMALRRVLNNKISRVRQHQGYESMFTLIDSLIMGNGILIDFCIACVALWLMQFN